MDLTSPPLQVIVVPVNENDQDAIEWIRLYIRSSSRVPVQSLAGFAYGDFEFSVAGEGLSIGVRFDNPSSRIWAEQQRNDVRDALEPWVLFERDLATELLPGGGYECRLKGSESTQVCSEGLIRYAVRPQNAQAAPLNLPPEIYRGLSEAVRKNEFLRLAKVYLWQGEIAVQEGRKDYVDVATLYYSKAAEALAAHPAGAPGAVKFRDKLEALNRLAGAGLSGPDLALAVRARNRVAHARLAPQAGDYFRSAFDLRNLVRQALLKLGLP